MKELLIYLLENNIDFNCGKYAVEIKLDETGIASTQLKQIVCKIPDGFKTHLSKAEIRILKGKKSN